MAIGPRKRFEVFKRDEFRCRYCGRTTPEVVLEVDHIVPRAEGGSDDVMNLATSCWQCNSGKNAVPLGQVMTGEDPHDRAVMILETERQLREYNTVLAARRARVEQEAGELMDFWTDARGNDEYFVADFTWLQNELARTPAEQIRRAMLIALGQGHTRDLRYVAGILRNWKEQGEPGA